MGGAQKQLEGTEVGPGPAGQGHSGETHNAAGQGGAGAFGVARPAPHWVLKGLWES